MPPQTDAPDWDFSSAIYLLKSLSLSTDGGGPEPHGPPPPTVQDDQTLILNKTSSHLGDFGSLWSLFGGSLNEVVRDIPISELEAETTSKGVRWRDEFDGADLEDNVEPSSFDTVASIRTQKRAARRARARLRAGKLADTPAIGQETVSDTAADAESSEELERLRQSPDRRAVIQDILGRRRPRTRDTSSPPTSPSPPKSDVRSIKKEWLPSNPFLWPVGEFKSSFHRIQIAPQDGLPLTARKRQLITTLARSFPTESKYLSNSGLIEPAFTPLNVSTIGIHVFIDISNIMIGFHDCLKVARDIPITTRVRRVPMCFHSFSLVLERGRPAAKRVLVGSDKFPIIQQAKAIGYETNILERVHKAKEITPRRKHLHSGGANPGVSSGSESNPVHAPEKWVEQAVDEILHLKILESLIDADRPSTIVLATGDAAEAEYSGGFMRMVERALEKGWMVELVSFKLNTSSAYTRTEFRAKWGPMFKWIPLDAFAEQLMDSEE